MPKVEVPERSIATPRSASAGTARRRRRRWWPRLLLLAVAGIVLLPTGLSIFGGVPLLLKKAHPKLAEAFEFRTIHLHWWAPVELNGVVLHEVGTPAAEQHRSQPSAADAADVAAALSSEQVPIARITRIRTTEPLWKVVTQLGRGVTITVSEPKLRLVVDEHSSNLQDTLTEVFGHTSAPAAPTFPVRVIIENGEAVLTSVQTGSRSAPTAGAAVSGIRGTISTLDASRALPELRLMAEVRKSRSADPAVSGVTEGRAGGTRLSARLDDVVSDFPVVPLDPFPAEINRTIAADGESDTTKFFVEILPSESAPQRQRIRLAARQLDLRLVQPLLGILVDGLACDGVVSCDVDAELAGHKLTEGLAGRVRLAGEQLRIRQSDWAAGEWLALGTTSLSGAIAVAEDGILLNQLKLSSDVVEAAGSGELRADRADQTAANSVELRGTINLVRLAEGLPETLALHPDIRLTKGDIVFGFKGEAVSAGTTDGVKHDSGMRWLATVQNDRIEAIRGGRPIILESPFRVDAVGPVRNGFPEIAQARLTASFGTISLTPDQGSFVLDGTVRPALLWEQLQHFVDMAPPGIQDELTFQTRAAVNNHVTQLTELQINSSELHVSSREFRIHHLKPVPGMLEGTVQIEGTGAAIRTLVAPWHAATWLAGASRVVVDLTASPKQQLHLRAVVQPAALAAAVRGPVRSVSQQQPQMRPAAGLATRLSASESVPSAIQIDEALAELNLSTDARAETYQIQNGLLQLPGISAAVSGSMKVVGADLELNLTADTDYDLAVLCSRLLATDSSIRLQGQGRDQFRITGSPSMRDSTVLKTGGGTLSGRTPDGLAPDGLTPLRATGGLSWQSGWLWGLELGPGTLKAALENGVLRAQPIQCALNSGEINIMPQYDMGLQRLQLATGSRITNVDLTPELCREWLGYLAPMLAESTSVAGRISARAESFDYDLNAPENSAIVGVVTIHSAEANAGTSLQPLLDVMELVRRAEDPDRGPMARSIVMPAQDIPVQLTQGAVRHQGLTIELAGYRAKSGGLVGLNRQLQLVLEIPLEKSTGVGSAKSVRVPVGGTIDRPQPDMATLVQSLGTNALQKQLGDRFRLDQFNPDSLNGQQLNNQVDKQLNKLFDKLR